MTYRQGDVVLIDFVFSDESGIKKRPTVVVSTESYHVAREEVIVAAVTSNVKRLLLGDCRISGWRQAGLLHPSVVTAILRTIKRSMIRRKLGTLTSLDIKGVQSALRQYLGL